ncbi:MAG: CoA-binding protein [Candidatus Helarchaeota archaeon]|nr:CoA-binding protein [Candidatus Helarchaeota archaeon]
MKLEEKLALMEIMFNPKNVAIIGASENLIKVGGMVATNIRIGGFKKKIYAINPNPKYNKNKSIYGIEVLPSLDKCPEQIDLVGIVVPSTAVLDSIKQAIECDIRTAVIITAGFGEVQTKDRQDENKELIKMAEKAGLIFVGPNSLGIYSSENEASPLHLGMGFMTPQPGTVAIISQSGTMGAILSNMMTRIRYFVSSGNEACLLLEDYLEYFAQDEKTDIIALFIEGLRAASRFKQLCSELTIKKPVVVLKGGRTKSGSRAAFSHTSSIAGSKDIYNSYFKQAGIIRAENINQFMYLVKGASFLLPLPQHEPLRIGIISGGGGYGIVLADLCEEQGLEVVNLHTHPNGPKLIEQLSEHLPFYWSRNNPIDLVASRDFDLIPKVVENILNYDVFDILFIQTHAFFRQMLNSFQPINEFGKKMRDLMKAVMKGIGKQVSKTEINLCTRYPDKKLIYISPVPTFVDPLFEKYGQHKILIFPGNPEIAAVVLRKLHDYQKYVNRRK